MADLTVRGVPEELHAALKEEAERNHRSLNQEVIHRLEASVRAPRRDSEDRLERIRRLRDRLPPHPPVDDDLLEEARSGGRP